MDNTLKLSFSIIGAFLASKLGIVYPAFLMLWVFMALDYVTGMLAAYKQGKWNSTKGLWGFVKKVLYAVIVCVAVAVDWIIIYYTEYIGFVLPIHSFFGVMVALWFVFNELISIMENCLKLETHLPPFFNGFLKMAKKIVDTTGEEFVNSIDPEKGEE